ncbi:MAG: Thiamine-phosphate pyrophosphorylase [Clostridia bacterium]|jgi:thiamine-phosphate pyrophosphorylase|nr:Thiamine-phosphate pyrophosphorylase [Clostridia bacterium]
MLLYAVTDRTWLGEELLENQVEKAIQGGITFLQLREKALDYHTFVRQALKIKKVTDHYKIPFVINDNVEVAIEVGADGVHIGQQDGSARAIREVLGKDKILGVSVQTVEQAVAAEKDGADYLGVGAVFSTATKLDAKTVSFETLKDISQVVSIPIVAIGGISRKNLSGLKGSGIDGIAVVSAIFAQEDIQVATQKLHEAAKEVIG